MPWDTQTLTREQLYNLVGERPVQHVAESIGVSDVALGKTCRRLGIPVPGRGYWARKAAGAKLTQTPLPKLKPGQQPSYTLHRRTDPEGQPMPSPKIIPVETSVPEKLKDPHALVKSSIPLLRQAKELRDDLLQRKACLAITFKPTPS